MGHTEVRDGASYAEGIGQTRVTKSLEGIAVGRSYLFLDQSGLTKSKLLNAEWLAAQRLDPTRPLESVLD
jgi:hypothetical protein